MEQYGKWIDGYENRYSIDIHGTVFSHNRYNNNSTVKPLVSTKDSRGYYTIALINRTKHIHRLVATTYIPMEEGRGYVNHKDGNKLNNHVDNLEWVTPKENSQHAWSTGLSKPSDIQKKVASAQGKLNKTFTNVEASEIRRIYFNSRYTQEEIAKVFGVCRKVIDNIATNKTYTEDITGYESIRDKYSQIKLKEF